MPADADRAAQGPDRFGGKCLRSHPGSWTYGAISSRAAGVLFLINIGLPILVGVLRGEMSAALIGGITGLLLSLADTEGPLGGRLRLTLMVAAGIVAGGALGTWLNLVRPIFWVAFFLAVFAAGLLNQLGKGPHFALRFGAISLAVVASLPALVPQEYIYFAGTVLLCLLSRSVDHFLNGPLAFAGPWLGNANFDRWGWLRFSLAYALSGSNREACARCGPRRSRSCSWSPMSA